MEAYTPLAAANWVILGLWCKKKIKCHLKLWAATQLAHSHASLNTEVPIWQVEYMMPGDLHLLSEIEVVTLMILW